MSFGRSRNWLSLASWDDPFAGMPFMMPGTAPEIELGFAKYGTPPRGKVLLSSPRVPSVADRAKAQLEYSQITRLASASAGHSRFLRLCGGSGPSGSPPHLPDPRSEWHIHPSVLSAASATSREVALRARPICTSTNPPRNFFPSTTSLISPRAS